MYSRMRIYYFYNSEHPCMYTMNETSGPRQCRGPDVLSIIFM